MKRPKRYNLTETFNGGEMIPHEKGRWVGWKEATKTCVIEFHKTFIGKRDYSMVKAIKRDFGLECKEVDHGDYKTWEIIGNCVVMDLTAKDIFYLDEAYGILCFEKNKIVLR